jgi:lysozyme
MSAYLPPVMSDVVIDISHYDTVSQDFAATAKAGIVAVILKATQGTGFVDPTFLARAEEAKAAGLLVGAYHFLDGSDPAAQMAHFLTVANSEAGVDRLAVDFEPYPSSQASSTQAATAVASVYAALGKRPLLYMGRYQISRVSKTLSMNPLWLPEYGSNPICPPGFSTWMLWQHTDGQVGSAVVPVPGIGPCDRSKFAGSVEQLRAWW